MENERTYEIVPGSYNSKNDVKVKVTQKVEENKTKIETIGDIKNRLAEIASLTEEKEYLEEFMSTMQTKDAEIQEVIKE